MSTIKRILKNVGIVFVGSNALKVLSMILVFLIARYLGDAEYGKFSFVLSFTGMFFILLDLGTRILIVREIAKNKEKAPKILSNVLSLKLITSIIVYLMIIVLAFLLNYETITFYGIAIAAVGIMFDSLATTLGSVYQAFERMEFPVSFKIIRILVRFAITVPLLLKGYGFLPVLIVFVSVQFLNFLMSLLVCYNKFVKLVFDFDKAYIISLVKRAFPFLLSGIFVTVYFRIDITLMSKLAPQTLQGIYSGVSREAIMGWYSAAYNILDGLISIPGAISIAILPVAIIYFKNSQEKLIRLYKLSVKYLTFLSIPIATGITILAPKIITVIYGPEYSNSVLPLQILVWTLIPLYINYVLGVINIAIHKEKAGVYVLFGTSIVNIVLNLILIPKLSLYGAAIATLLSELFYFTGYYYINNKALVKINPLRYMVKPIISAGLMGYIIFKLINYHVFILIPIGCVVYFILMFILKAFAQEDLDVIKKIITLRK